MDINSQDQSVSQATDTSSTPAASPASAPAEAAPAQAAAPADPNALAAAPAEWQPNLKYKAGREEKEFDAIFKDLVKSQEHEKRLRELYEKADGIDVVKMSRDQYKKHLDEVQGKFTPIEKELKQLGTFMQRDDLESAFALLGIPEQKVINYIANKLQYNQMSPEERSRVDAQRQLRQENYGKMSEVETLQQRIQEQEVQNLGFQLSVLQETPKFAEAAAIFDNRIGQSGAFMNKFLEVGDYLTTRNGGQTVPPSQVFDVLMKEYGLAEAQSAQSAPPPQAKPVVTTSPVEKPTIPNLRGSKTASPVKSKPKSLDDLKRMQRDMAAR